MASNIKPTLFSVVIFLSFNTLSCNKDDIIESIDPDLSTGNEYVDKVFEWTPAPGQFINEFGSASNEGEILTPQQAADWSLQKISNHQSVSLGSFGGYIIAGFNHNIYNTGEYEIGVLGNAFIDSNGNSNEPGIVYVMKDENGNGLPDDQWFELRGSDTFSPGTIRNYEVTYFRPDGPGQPVKWIDNFGNTGQVEYMEAFHKQSSYYPLWIEDEKYTLSGTCLEAKSKENPETGKWENPPFEWGYADNIGEDNIAFAGFSNCNRFRISDAIDTDGDPVELDYINFVKIQTGVSAQAGWLGEVSTEILGIVDLTTYSSD